MNKADKIGEIVAAEHLTASVFRKHKIDFCCGGGKSLEKVCDEKSLNTMKLIEELNEVVAQSENKTNSFKDWPLDKLIDHIETKHHSYVKRATGDLIQYLEKLVKVHGHYNPELNDIRDRFALLSQELAAHMQKEELILFPYIKKMANTKNMETEHFRPAFGNVENPIQMMEAEHEIAGMYMENIRELSNDYTPPEHACNTYLVAYKVLEDFEKDLHMHIHLENNILFPGSVQMENNLLKTL